MIASSHRLLPLAVLLSRAAACGVGPTTNPGAPDGGVQQPDGGGAQPDGSVPPPDAGVPPDASVPAATFESVPGWSVRRQVHSAGADLFVEEKLASFTQATPGASRVRTPAVGDVPERTWSAPDTLYLNDACRHPSGEVSGVLVGEDFAVSLVRLAPDLTLLTLTPFHDPEIAHDPGPPGSAPTDLQTGGLTFDAARISCVGEDALFVVDAVSNSVLVYRAAFADGAWAPARRTLVEPATGITLLIPTGGTFDTFEAMTITQRSLIDVDEAGNAYVATYAQLSRIRAHVALFQDGLTRLPGDPGEPLTTDADVLLTSLDAAGARRWSRVIGTSHEDEPYAIRARGGAVAVVGRTRRNPGFDNTFWDAFISVTAENGDAIGTQRFELNQSGILLAVDALPEGGWVLGGSDGWSQNPDGLSVLSFGTKLLLVLPSLGDAPARIDLPAGPRHNEVRSVLAGADAIRIAGQEDGPVMHTGDGDLGQIHANGVIGVIPRAAPACSGCARAVSPEQ